jgi:anti-sigma factor RsiW
MTEPGCDDPRCEEMHLLVQADIDSELTPSESARVGAHLMHCAGCAELQASLLALSSRIRQEVAPFALPAAREQAIRARVTMQVPRPANANRVRRQLPYVVSLALAACLAFVVLLPTGQNLPDAVVSAHIRALQPGHLMDVVSTDQHTVKPWFDGRLPFAPPVKDLASAGFPLVGGRLDYLAGHSAAVMIYRHGQHFINLFVWPEAGVLARTGSRDGYEFTSWHQDGLAFWAVSDVAASDLATFIHDWRED